MNVFTQNCGKYINNEPELREDAFVVNSQTVEGMMKWNKFLLPPQSLRLWRWKQYGPQQQGYVESQQRETYTACNTLENCHVMFSRWHDGTM